MDVSEAATGFPTIELSDRHLAALRDARVYGFKACHYRGGWLKRGAVIELAPCEIEPYASFRRPGFFSMGAFSYSRSAFDYQTRIGRYCSLANSIKVMQVGHPTTRLSGAPFTYSQAALFEQALHDRGTTAVVRPYEQDDRPLVIGNDVWIGAEVMIRRGVTIGHGAVIGARTVVTKDVPPYAIFAGNPGRVRGWRFDEATIARLLASRWWDYHFADFQHLDTTEPNRFLDAFDNLNLQPWSPPKFDPMSLAAL